MTTTAHTPKCKRCGRTLRSLDSIARGRGRHCERLHRREQAAKLVLANYTEVQVAKVLELLADGGIARVDRHRFLAVASNGIDRYEVDVTAALCTCKAGQNGRQCYHLAAATLATA